MSRYHDPQFQVAENYSFLFNLSLNIANFDDSTLISSPMNVIQPAHKTLRRSHSTIATIIELEVIAPTRSNYFSAIIQLVRELVISNMHSKDV